MDLFDGRQITKKPLAARMRPRTLDEYIGKEQIVGKGLLLRRAIATDQLTSVIFYGPPGTGKTTLAKVIANHTKSNFITLNAVLTGVQNIRDAIAQAEQNHKLYERKTILFVDEVHRWNKSQQDALLPWVENGTIILVGATTENPFFEVNKALVSRSRVFQLKPLEYADLEKAAKNALTDEERGYGRWNVQFEKGALEHLIDTANGDARSLLNALELAVETTPEKWDPKGNPPTPAEGSLIFISKETAEESIQRKVVLYDRDGDYHYDIISAFIKSLRGRDPDATMYWLARMIAAGEDPGFIFRRMLISACEDTGLADPYALTVVESCAAAFDRVGLPEGRYHLAHAALYLSTAPKSNSSMAFFDALAAVEKEDAEVPNHLKDSSRDATGFGHGAGYMYPHAYKDHWVAQQYLPDTLTGRVFYNPSDQGYEKNIRNEVLSRRETQIATILEEHLDNTLSSSLQNPENPVAEWWQTEHFKVATKKTKEQLSYSPEDKTRTNVLRKGEMSWRQRLDSNHAENLNTIRNQMLNLSNIVRHSRNFIWNADDGLLLWECMRQSPEGLTIGFCKSSEGKKILEQYGQTLNNIDKPILETYNLSSLPSGSFFIDTNELKDILIDNLFFRDQFNTIEGLNAFVESLSKIENRKYFAKNWKCILSQKIPCKNQRISTLLKKYIPSDSKLFDAIEKMHKAEEIFFTNTENSLFNWNEETVKQSLSNKFTIDYTNHKIIEKRKISSIEINRWFDTQNSAYGSFLAEKLTSEEFCLIQKKLEEIAEKNILDWKSEISFFSIQDK